MTRGFVDAVTVVFAVTDLGGIKTVATANSENGPAMAAELAEVTGQLVPKKGKHPQ